MKQKQRASKRIVSKGEYAKTQLRKLWAWLCIVLPFCCLGLLFWRSPHKSLSNNPAKSFAFDLITLTIMSAGIYSVGKSYLQFCRTLEPVVPLTRANTADLPAPDSLVRASQEPMQARQTVLLRAVTSKTPDEKALLLRAVAEEE